MLCNNVYSCIVLCPQETHRDSEFYLFESQQYGESDLLFKDATRCLVHTGHMNYRTILGKDFISHLENIFNCTYSGETEYTYESISLTILL